MALITTVMSFDNKGPKSPPKGKKEEFTWNTGWWDFYPLVEKLSSRRVEWSNSSIIFSPHADQPRILARHFSSSKKFNIPAPAPILAAPAAYDPPSVISASPDDLWLFSYFPGKGGDGTACIWARGAEIDNWAVKEYWSTAPGAGIVAISWLGPPREWTTDPNGSFLRLPTRGPTTPVSSPTLLLVTQNHRLTLFYLRNYIPTLKMISVSLIQADSANEAQPIPDMDPANINILRLCSSAAIGLGYDEPSILVATRSHVLPYPQPNTPNDHFNAMEMNMPLDFDQQNMDAFRSDDPCGEESVINLTQVTLKFNGILMNLSTLPLDPLSTSKTHLSGLTFASQPSVEKGIKGSLRLLSTFIDFGDYSSTPQSTMVCHSFSRAEENGILTWKRKQEASRLLGHDIVGFLTVPKFHHGCVYLGAYSTSGSLVMTPHKEKDVQIGSTRILRLPDLTDDTCDQSPILSSPAKAGREIPIAVSFSPNDVLLCSLSSNLFSSQVSVHAPPKRPTTEAQAPSLSTGLAIALLSRRTTADFVHVLSLPSVSLDEVANVLFHTLTIVETQPKGQHSALTWQTIGVALEIYRYRSKRASDDSEKECLTARWQSAHDLCSLAACNAAFDSCKDGDGPDLNAVWQFTAICTWIINFIEKVMKEAMLRSSNTSRTESDVDLFGADPESSPSNEQPVIDSPYLLHIVHPYALKSFKSALDNTRTFRNRLVSLNCRGENAHIAKQIVLDLVNCASVDLDALEPILDEFIERTTIITVEDSRRSLAACEPTMSMHTQLLDNIRRLCDSGVISKSQLYIKPSELIDGFENLSLEKHSSEQDHDVISKGALLKRPKYVRCLRCDGRSEVAIPKASAPITSMRWRAWERQWVPACLCGGSWIMGSG